MYICSGCRDVSVRCEICLFRMHSNLSWANQRPTPTDNKSISNKHNVQTARRSPKGALQRMIEAYDDHQYSGNINLT